MRWQKIAVESPAYGYRRITAELQRRGFDINHKRVLRMMREDNLLCVRRRSFVVTTDSRHNLPVYPNLARQTVPTAINQLWVADITYTRLRIEFVNLEVVLDAFSRRVVGWALGRNSHPHSSTRPGLFMPFRGYKLGTTWKPSRWAIRRKRAQLVRPQHYAFRWSSLAGANAPFITIREATWWRRVCTSR